MELSPRGKAAQGIHNCANLSGNKPEIVAVLFRECVVKYKGQYSVFKGETILKMKAMKPRLTEHPQCC